MKKVLKIALHAYSVFCMCVVTALLIAGIVVWANFGRITSYAAGKIVDSYNDEINGVISDYFEKSVPDDSIQFISLDAVKGGGLQASFSVDANAMDVDLGSYQERSNEEIIAELGITVNDIPAEIMPLLSLIKETLVIDLVDENGDAVLKRTITPEEIMKLLKAD